MILLVEVSLCISAHLLITFKVRNRKLMTLLMIGCFGGLKSSLFDFNHILKISQLLVQEVFKFEIYFATEF
jgi:hypothetical protein